MLSIFLLNQQFFEIIIKLKFKNNEKDDSKESLATNINEKFKENNYCNSNVIESFETLEKTNFLTFNNTRNRTSKRDTLDLTFRDTLTNSEAVLDDSSKSAYLRLKNILTESFEVEEDVNDLPSRKIKEIPAICIKTVVSY